MAGLSWESEKGRLSFWEVKPKPSFNRVPDQLAKTVFRKLDLLDVQGAFLWHGRQYRVRIRQLLAYLILELLKDTVAVEHTYKSLPDTIEQVPSVPRHTETVVDHKKVFGKTAVEHMADCQMHMTTVSRSVYKVWRDGICRLLHINVASLLSQ